MTRLESKNAAGMALHVGMVRRVEKDGVTGMARKRKTNGKALVEAGLDSAMVESQRGILKRKYPKEILSQVVKCAAEIPVVSVICRNAKINRTNLRYWLVLSRKGGPGDGFDLPVPGDESRTERFHVLYEDALQEAADAYEVKMNNLATGIEREILSDKGRVQYKYDPELVGLGLTGEEAYLRDENNQPIPESVPTPLHVQAEMVRWVLARLRPEKYGNKMQVEHEHRGGVMVVGAQMSPQQIEKAFGGSQKLVDVEFEEVTNGETAS